MPFRFLFIPAYYTSMPIPFPSFSLLAQNFAVFSTKNAFWLPFKVFTNVGHTAKGQTLKISLHKLEAVHNNT